MNTEKNTGNTNRRSTRTVVRAKYRSIKLILGVILLLSAQTGKASVHELDTAFIENSSSLTPSGPQVGDTIFYGSWFIVVTELMEPGVRGTMSTPFGTVGTGGTGGTGGMGLWIQSGIEWNGAQWVLTSGSGPLVTLRSIPDYISSLNLNLDTLVIGQEICREKDDSEIVDSTGISVGNGLDAWGFDSTGVHHITGDTIDLNGFNKDGIHHATGTAYNECGCSREELTEDGQECDPTDCARQNKSQALADSLRTSIVDSLILVINDALSDITDSLQSVDCQTIRDELENLVDNSGLIRCGFIGHEDILFEPGFSKHFESEPKKLIATGVRDADRKELEEKHISLYRCDKKEVVYNQLDTLLNQLLSDSTAMQSLANELINAIAQWSEYEYTKYTTNNEDFRNWILAFIGGYSDVEIPDIAAIENVQNDISSEDYGIKKPQGLIDDKVFNRSVLGYSMQSMPLVSAWYANMLDSIVRIQAAGNNSAKVKKKSAVYRKNMSVNPIISADYMPVVIEKTIGNSIYKIIVDNIDIYADSFRFSAYCIIHDSKSNRDLLFSGHNITVLPTGQLINARLTLGGTVQINLFNSVRLTLNGGSDTYVDWDVDGFQSMGIDANVEVCRNLLIPLDSTLKPKPEPELMAFDLSVQNITEWLEFTVTISGLSPFAIAGLENDVAFELTNLMLDFSSDATPNFTPVEGYTSPHFYSGSDSLSNAWKGIYIESISATILRDMTTTENEVVLSANQVLIDGDGFSGQFIASNVLHIDEGSAAGWPFSIDDFQLTFIRNKLHAGGLGGEIELPVADDQFPYAATINQNFDVTFTISPPDSLHFNVWIADVHLHKNSSITAKYISNELTLEANLHGELDIVDGTKIGSLELTFPDLEFKNLFLSTADPHMKVGSWGMKDSTAFEAKIGGFSLKIENVKGIEVDSSDLKGISFDITLQLAGEKINIGAKGGFDLLGKMHFEQNTGNHKWKYESLFLNKLGIKGSFQGVASIEGELEWFGHHTPDSVYGKGVRGYVQAEFEGLGVGVTAVAQFGKVDDYKYFYVDAFANLSNLNISVGVLKLTGFGGGVSFRMTMDQDAMLTLGAVSSFDGLAHAGATISGATLIPDNGTGLGLNANIGFAVVNEEIFNGMGGFRIEFDTGRFSVQLIAITGVGQFLQSVSFDMEGEYAEGAQAPPPNSAPLAAYAKIIFDFEAKSLHGDIQVFANTPFVYGAGTGGKLVDAEFHIGRGDWYIYIGRPEEGQRCGLVVDLGVLEVRAEAYFDVGTNVPSMPPLPATVRELAYKVNTNETLRQSGQGMVFGASLTIRIAISAGKIVEAEVEAGAGFDVMLKKYEDLMCQGSNEPVGIDGWYSAGQFWAYLRGSLKLFGVPIFEAGLAAVLQARMPNPFWAQATVGIKVRILGFEKRKSLKLELGDDCLLVGQGGGTDPDIGLDIISFISPMDGMTDVNLFFQPEVQFAIPLGATVPISDLNDPEIVYEFKTVLKEISFVDSDSFEVALDYDFTSDTSHVTLLPYDLLNTQDTFTIRVTVEVYKDGDLVGTQTKMATFTTPEEELNVIPVNNVKFSYPAHTMTNFYKANDPTQHGYVQLKRGQARLFADRPEYSQQYVKLTRKSDGAFKKVDFEYIPAEYLLKFPMDTSFLINQEEFRLEIIETEKAPIIVEEAGEELSILEGIAANPNIYPPSNEDVNAYRNAEFVERIMYEVDFRVSGYNTFTEKMNDIKSIQLQDAFGNPSSSTRDVAAVEGKLLELVGELTFDKMETQGSPTHPPLLKLNAVAGTALKAELIGHNGGPGIDDKIEEANSLTDDECKDKIDIIDVYTLVAHAPFSFINSYEIPESQGNTSSSSGLLDPVGLFDPLDNDFDFTENHIENQVVTSVYDIDRFDLTILNPAFREFRGCLLDICVDGPFQADCLSSVQALQVFDKIGISNRDTILTIKNELKNGTRTIFSYSASIELYD